MRSGSLPALLLCLAGPVMAGVDSVATARADLAMRLQVAPDRVELLSHDEVTWPDGSLGCPRPGMMYPQVLVDGERLIFGVDGRRFHYHAGGTREFFYCDNPGSTVGNAGVSNK